MKIKNILLGLFIVLSVIFIFGCEFPQAPKEKVYLTRIFEEAVKDVPEMIYEGELLNLPEKVEEYRIKYSFDKPEFFDDNYKVVYADEFGNKVVKLICEIDGKKYNKDIRVHQKMSGYFDKIFEYIEGYLPDDICNSDLKLQTSYLKDEVEITYTSNKPEFITN